MTLEEVAENHGLTPEGVDYALKQYQIVICEITHGMMSKLSYDAKDIIRVAQERWCDLKEQEAIKPYMDYDGQDVWRCGKCGNSLMHPSYYESDEDAKNYIKYCSHCGRKIKWNNKEDEDGT